MGFVGSGWGLSRGLSRLSKWAFYVGSGWGISRGLSRGLSIWLSKWAFYVGSGWGLSRGLSRELSRGALAFSKQNNEYSLSELVRVHKFLGELQNCVGWSS